MNKEKSLDSIYILLVGNEFAGNAGQVARIMGNFAVSKLVIIDPQWKDATQGLVFAHTPEGLEIFDNRLVFESLEEAIQKLKLALTIALTRRSGKERQINTDYRDYFTSLAKRTIKAPLGIVFGRETSGLTAKEIDLCSVLVYIPASSKSASLNVSQAVALVCAELFYTTFVHSSEYSKKMKIILHETATQEDRELFYKDIISHAGIKQLFIKNDYASFRRLFERIFTSHFISRKDLKLLKDLLVRFLYAKEK